MKFIRRIKIGHDSDTSPYPRESAFNLNFVFKTSVFNNLTFPQLPLDVWSSVVRLDSMIKHDRLSKTQIENV